MIGVHSGAGLGGHADVGELFRDWLGGHGQLGAASAELQAFFDIGQPGVTGPIWQDQRWRRAWLDDFIADLSDPADADAIRASVRDLAAGDADVVITGQQPGFLGGPLYTAYKVATTIVLAEMRTAAGRPTVPVFWSGDDDDDIREALRPVAWDPRRHVLLRHADHDRRGLGADRMVGALPAAEVADGEAAFLAELGARGGLSGDLAAIWADGLAGGASWGRLQRRALLRMFRGRGLLIVSGDDPDLHGAASGFYTDLWTQRERLRDGARAGGRELAAAGYEAAVTEPSIQRFLHLGSGGTRRPLAAEHKGSLPDAAQLRPGVVARSLVQDWLFRPAGVVVGPGEVAYLKQLAPAYAAFGLYRAPLLPRLFAQLGPAGYGAFRTWALGVADRDNDEPEPEHGTVAQRVAAAARPELLAALRTEAAVPADRLDLVADLVQRRWARLLESVLKREQRRRRDDPATGQTAWLRPEGRRQERSLAALGAAALWGDEFADALTHASRRHLDAGLDGDWREFLLTVPEP
jgi:hypothetical protein